MVFPRLQPDRIDHLFNPNISVSAVSGHRHLEPDCPHFQPTVSHSNPTPFAGASSRPMRHDVELLSSASWAVSKVNWFRFSRMGGRCIGAISHSLFPGGTCGFQGVVGHLIAVAVDPSRKLFHSSQPGRSGGWIDPHFHFAGNGGSSGFGCVFRAENSRTGLDCFGVLAGLGNVFQAIQGSTGTEGMSLRSNKTKPLIT